MERLNPERWELCVLATRFGAESIRRALRRQDVEVIAFPERFDHIVAAVRGAACDLLYYWEVGTDPTNYFLPFLRLAPVQVTSWGIQVTSGIPNLDAYLSSDLVESSGAQSHYTERLVRATTLLTYQTPGREAGDGQGNRQALPGLESLLPDQHLYGCVQNLGKFHPEFDEGLAGILRSDPRGVIVTTRDPSGLAARILRERWQARFPDVADRIWFLPPLPQADYWKVLEACEVLLDPWHFGGVTTTYDALALAQPLITLPSPYHRGRYTAACLRKIGVVATIAADPTDYVRLAVTTACDREFREEIRWQMFSSSQGAFEDDAAVGEHERIFAQLLAGSR